MVLIIAFPQNAATEQNCTNYTELCSEEVLRTPQPQVSQKPLSGGLRDLLESCSDTTDIGDRGLSEQLIQHN